MEAFPTTFSKSLLVMSIWPFLGHEAQQSATFALAVPFLPVMVTYLPQLLLFLFWLPYWGRFQIMMNVSQKKNSTRCLSISIFTKAMIIALSSKCPPQAPVSPPSEGLEGVNQVPRPEYLVLRFSTGAAIASIVRIKRAARKAMRFIMSVEE